MTIADESPALLSVGICAAEGKAGEVVCHGARMGVAKRAIMKMAR